MFKAKPIRVIFLIIMILSLYITGCTNQSANVEHPPAANSTNNENIAADIPEDNAENDGAEPAESSSNLPVQTYHVTRVVDGDTIEIIFNENKEKVRFIGVDTPETKHPTKGVQPYGPEASTFTKENLEDKDIALEFDVQERDCYGRLLAYVYTEDGVMFNARLVEEGYAQMATFPPNVKYVDRFKKLQEEARENSRGLWGLKEKEVPENSNATQTKGMYVGSINSDKYHKPDCKWAKKISSKNEIWFKHPADAKTHGYKPCGVCRPN